MNFDTFWGGVFVADPKIKKAAQSFRLGGLQHNHENN